MTPETPIPLKDDEIIEMVSREFKVDINSWNFRLVQNILQKALSLKETQYKKAVQNAEKELKDLFYNQYDKTINLFFKKHFGFTDASADASQSPKRTMKTK